MIRKRNNFKWTLSNPAKAIVSSVALLAAAAAVGHAQTVYSTNFDTTGGTYTTPAELQGQNSWTSNDPDQNAAAATGPYVGGTDYVGTLPNFSTTAPFSGNGGLLGGGVGRNTTPANDNVPGMSTVFLARPFTLGLTASQGYTFDVDLAVTTSSTSFPSQDTFAWTLRDNSGNKLLTLSFVPSTSTVDAFRATVGNGSAVSSGFGIVLNAIYHLNVNINPISNTFSATLQGATGPAVTAFNNASLVGAPITAGQVTQVAATWDLANKTASPVTGTNGGYFGAGSNSLLFDNYTVAKNTVPEPSTYLMMGLGFVSVIGMTKFRRLR